MTGQSAAAEVGRVLNTQVNVTQLDEAIQMYLEDHKQDPGLYAVTASVELKIARGNLATGLHYNGLPGAPDAGRGSHREAMMSPRSQNRSAGRERKVTAALALCLCIAACGRTEGRHPPVNIETYPEREVMMIVPFGAGGGSDILSRTIVNVIGELDLLPVPVLVENRPGGAGAIGYHYVAQQEGNPYALATLSVSFFTTPLLGDSPTGPDDYTPVAAIAMSPYIMAVRDQSPLGALHDIKAHSRLTSGTIGVASDAVMLSYMLQNASGVRIDPVPFDSEGEVMTGILGGHLDIMFGNPGEILPQIEAGNLRALAVSTPERLQSLPDVPTFKELGYDIEHVQFRGIVMPNGVPPAIVSSWQEILRQVATSDEWKTQYLERFRDEPYFVAGEEFAELVETRSELYRELLDEMGFLPE